jgi:lipoate-protein ligase A
VKFLDLTLPTPEENLALDEALLLTAEADGAVEYLRVWESPCYFVVLGKNCKVADDVRVENCRADRVPILRRVSGGGTVLQGPGCLNFSLVLGYERAAELKSVSGSFTYVLDRIRAALTWLGIDIQIAGTDLMRGDRKVSGNCQRRQLTGFIHQGTILYRFDVPSVARYLFEPLRQPAHRARRDHIAFLTNLGVEPTPMRDRLQTVWQAADACDNRPMQLVTDLVQTRYRQQSWNLGR